MGDIVVDGQKRVYALMLYGDPLAYRVSQAGTIDKTWRFSPPVQTGEGVTLTATHVYFQHAKGGGQSMVYRFPLDDGASDSWMLQFELARSAKLGLVQLSNGDLLFVGPLVRASVVPCRNMVRVSPTNPLQIDPFVAPVTGSVFDVARSADGRLFIVGDFTAVDGKARNGIAELDPSAISALDTWTP